MSLAAAQQKQNPVWLASKPFVLGFLSAGFATACIQPIDMVKVRIQLSGEGGGKAVTNPLQVASSIYRNEGILRFYTGLSAALFRQFTYGTARLGIFRVVLDKLAPSGKATFRDRFIAGVTAGAMGALIGSPADLTLIRMQADNLLPPEQRRNYRGVTHALISIVKKDGFPGLFRGCVPTMIRAMFINVGLLTTFEQSKDFFKDYMSPAWTSFAGSMVSGFFGSAFSLPLDFIKTRIQKQKPLPDGSLPYKSTVDCFLKVLKAEGPFAFYRGFGTYYIRIAPHAVISLNVLDALNSWCKKRGL